MRALGPRWTKRGKVNASRLKPTDSQKLQVLLIYFVHTERSAVSAPASISAKKTKFAMKIFELRLQCTVYTYYFCYVVAVAEVVRNKRNAIYNKRLCYCRGTARRATSVEILWTFFD